MLRKVLTATIFAAAMVVVAEDADYSINLAELEPKRLFEGNTYGMKDGSFTFSATNRYFGAYDREMHPVQSGGHVKFSMLIGGRGTAGPSLLFYDKDGKYLSDCNGLMTLAEKTDSVIQYFRIPDTVKGTPVTYVRTGVYGSKGTEAEFADVKVSIRDKSPNLTKIPQPEFTAWKIKRQKQLRTLAERYASRGKRMEVMMLGDSITQAWLNEQSIEIWKKELVPLGAENFGISGDSIQNLLWRVTEGGELVGKPKIIVLLIGTNNLHQQPICTLDEIAEGYDNLLAVLHKAVPDSKILALAIYPRIQMDTKWPVTELNRKLAAVAAKHNYVTWLNLGELLLQGKPPGRNEIFPDGLHPSRIGCQIVADAIVPVIRDMQGEK